MQHEIKKYPVQHPVLKKYIKFFWEIHFENMRVDHKIIPQRNINLRFNLNETPHYECREGCIHKLESVYFSGLQDHFINSHLKLNGNADILGICFHPDGFYPFLKIPVFEFKNHLHGAEEIGNKKLAVINDKLKEADSVSERMNIIESELTSLLDNCVIKDENFRKIFIALKRCSSPKQISDFCNDNGIHIRQLERLFNKYVGVSALTYNTLNRFHGSLNQLLNSDYSKLSDLAYGNGYFDQMHFIKEFKRFTGNTPKNFVSQNNSILQIGKLS